MSEVLNDREFRLFLPKEYDGKRITKKEFKDVTGKICDRFGGATVFDVTGTWKSPKGIVMTEPVWVISADRDSENTKNYHKTLALDRKFMKQLARNLGQRFNQEVMFETRDRIEVDQIVIKRKNMKKVV